MRVGLCQLRWLGCNVGSSVRARSVQHAAADFVHGKSLWVDLRPGPGAIDRVYRALDLSLVNCTHELLTVFSIFEYFLLGYNVCTVRVRRPNCAKPVPSRLKKTLR